MQKEVALSQIAKRLRHHVLDMTTNAGSGHPTTCLSIAELMSVIFFDQMRFNPSDPKNLSNDEFVLSKGHASPILWATFAEAGIIKESQLKTYRKLNSQLEGHPTPRMPWIKVATGSLGQGLSAGLGLALAARIQQSPSRTFVMLGDGECAEGSVWEAAALAEKWKLTNITAVLDCNRLGQSGESLHGNNCARWAEKFAAFGWHAQVIDGHNVKEIVDAFETAKKCNAPTVIIAKTKKGNGVSFLEDKDGWHGKTLSREQLIAAKKELGAIPKVASKSFVRKPSEDRPAIKSRWPQHKSPEYKSSDSVATREAYGNMLRKLGANQSIVALDADVKNSTFSEKFKKDFPGRFFDCYIAEQNMVGAAAGLAAKGFIPFVSTFAAFLTRAFDQIRMAGISQLNVKFCGSHVGVSIGEDGPSQMGLEDISMFRTIPNSVILYPSDAISAEACTELMAKHKGISYLRTSRPKSPLLYNPKESFRIGGSKLLRSGKDAAIIAAGITVHEALKAADQLKKLGKSVTVIDAYSVKPLDEKTIRKHARNKRVIVVEDHHPEGGLGEAVALLSMPITHLAVKGVPMSGKPDELVAKFKINAESIVKAVLK